MSVLKAFSIMEHFVFQIFRSMKLNQCKSAALKTLKSKVLLKYVSTLNIHNIESKYVKQGLRELQRQDKFTIIVRNLNTKQKDKIEKNQEVFVFLKLI
jgi:hypothetical protein